MGNMSLTQNRKAEARTDQRLVSMSDWLDRTRKDPPKKKRKIIHQTTPQRLSENPRITRTTKNNPKHQQRGRDAGNQRLVLGFTW